MDDEGKTIAALKDELQALRRRNKELARSEAEARQSLAVLIASELQCRRLFETAKDGILLIDAATGAVIDANEAAADLAGCRCEDFRGKKLWDLAPFRGIDAGLIVFRELQDRERIRYDDLPFLTKNGGCKSVEFVCTAHPIDDQKVIQCTIRDITERKKIEEDLRKAEARFTALFRLAAIGIAVVDLEGAIVDNNRKLEEMLGFRENELRGRKMSDFTPPEDAAADAALYQELLAGAREAYQLTRRCRRRDGATIWGLVNTSLVRGAGGEPQFVIRTVDDVSEQKRAESAFQESEEKFRLLLDSTGEAIYGIDTGGNCTFCNPSCIRMLGYAHQDDLIGKNMHRLMHHTRKDGTPYPVEECRLMRAVSQGVGMHFEDEVLWRADGISFPAEVLSFPQQRNGLVIGAVVAFTDITERKRTEEAHRASEARFRDLAELLPLGVYEADKSGKVTYANHQALVAFGYKADEVAAGLSLLQTVTPEERLRVQEAIARIVGGETGGGKEYTALRKDGTTFPVLIYSAPIVVNGRTQGLRGVFIDLTERKQAEQELWKSRQLLQNVLDLLPVGVWITDCTGTIVTGNPAAKQIWAGQKYVGIDRYGEYKGWWAGTEKKIEPEDWAGARAVTKGETSLDEIIDIECFDGTRKTIVNSALPIKGPEGEIIAAIIVNQDITERKRADEALSRSESTLRSFYESAPVMMGVVELTEEDEIIHIYDNPATARFFGVQYASTENKPADEIGAPSEAIRQWVIHYHQSRREARPVRFEYIHPTPRGQLWLSATVASIGPGPSGRWRFSYVAEDITERKRVEEEIKQVNEMLKIQATTDLLTGIFNRLKFGDLLEQEMREAHRYKHPLSLVMFDVDQFKQINDTYGHLAGDDVLREISQLVSKQIRHADIFARWGGEEFMILAPHSGLENTQRLAEKMRALVEGHRFPTCPSRVTCSFGITRYLEADTVETFTNRADSAMYAAKKAGRNRVEVIEGSLAGPAISA